MDLVRCFFGVAMSSRSFNRLGPGHAFVVDVIVLLPFRPYTTVPTTLGSRRGQPRTRRPHLSPLPLLCLSPLLCRTNGLPRMSHRLPIIKLLRLAENFG